jgi:hypothetical protein
MSNVQTVIQKLTKIIKQKKTIKTVVNAIIFIVMFATNASISVLSVSA